MLLRELTHPTASTVDEAKKRKRKARRTLGMPAAYGPGPYGWYGYDAGYSGDSSGGGDGGGGESVNRGVAEARRNPEQNRKSGSGKYDLINFAEDNITDKDNWAVSMTMEPKLGVNPQAAVSEDTPKGIYFYPLQYFMQLADRDESLPWGDNMPYLQLFQYDRSGEMTQQTKVDPARLKQALLQYCPEEVIQQAIDEPEYDGTPYWFIYDCLSRLGKGDETNVIRWNKVLRDLGFTSVYDPGKGWIAYNEPTQGVVLDPRIIKQHKMFDNRNPTLQRRRYDIQGLADAIGWSSYYQRESQLQRIYNHPDEKKVMLDVAKSMLKQFLGKNDKEAKALGYDQAIKAAADKVIEILKQDQQSVAENFADGKNPQDKGDSKRHGINTKASVSSLRKTAKQGGRKGQLAHWLANMKAGKAKKNETLTEAVIHPSTMDALEDFLPFVMKLLKLDKLPRISVHKTIETGDQPSFGGYNPADGTIQLALKDRHPADVLRTLAHELVHFKQDQQGELDEQSGATGSDEENEANTKAGIIMRHFNKQFPQYLE